MRMMMLEWYFSQIRGTAWKIVGEMSFISDMTVSVFSVKLMM